MHNQIVDFTEERERFRIESLANLPNRIKILGKEYPDKYPIVEGIIKIEDFRTSMRYWDMRIEARVFCKIKTEMTQEQLKWLKYEYWNYKGSLYEPPDVDEWLGQDYAIRE